MATFFQRTYLNHKREKKRERFVDHIEIITPYYLKNTSALYNLNGINFFMATHNALNKYFHTK